MPPERRAYFSGFGLHTALGRGMRNNVASLREPIAPPQQVAFEYAHRVETVPYYVLADEPLVDIETRLFRVLTGVIEEALNDAGLSSQERQKLTLFLGTSSGEISAHEAWFRGDLKQSTDAAALSRSRGIGNLAFWIAKHFGFRGNDFTINTACTASANALIHADSMIRSGRIERALVVGLECCNAVTALGFQGLQLLTREAMLPFDERRRGMMLGEGCAAVVLQREARGANSFHLRGASNLCDTHSISAANTDGSTVRIVIEQALASAHLAPRDIGALKTHGTASLSNDEAEVTGMKQAFDSLPPLCALKPRIGHTLGACGLNELVLMCGGLREGWLPGTPGVSASAGDLGVTLNQEPCAIEPGNFMLNYFGFGGNNTALIVSNREA